MSKHLQSLLLSKKVLLLQGPMGDFFSRLAQWLDSWGIEAYKINFNGGDRHFYPADDRTFDFINEVEQFASWLRDFLQHHQIDAMVCFGDCRKYHVIAKQISIQLGIKFFAFEEGYIRPNYITFEQDGVNSFSKFLVEFDDAEIKEQQDVTSDLKDVQNSYAKMVRCAIFYYLFWIFYSFKYPNYQHHRNISPAQECKYWIISGFRSLKNKCVEKMRFNSFLKKYSHQYYIFSLQVHNDAQIRVHSELKDVQDYIELVMHDFSQNAPVGTHLLLKHHPMDRGYRNYHALIQRCARELNIEGRVHYFCDIHFPSLLKNGLGLVTVNSTTGIQALYHHVPVKVLGSALYDLPRLTFQGSLAEFWQNPGEVDQAYFDYFRHELIEYSQLNGSFYGISPWKDIYVKQTHAFVSTQRKDVKHKESV